MNCEDIQDLFQKYVAGTLPLPQRAAVETHLAGCDRCRRELTALRATLGAVAGLPRAITPPDDLWPVIAGRIDELKVVPGRFGAPPARPRWTSPRMLAVAAVALVVLSSALTFMATRRLHQVRPPTGTLVSTEFLTLEAQYSRASDEILFALQQGEVRIAPETRTILERNLRVIDTALAESRAALAADPANQELKDMVLSTYEHKLDLLPAGHVPAVHLMRGLLLGFVPALAVASLAAAQERVDRRIAVASDASIRVVNLTGSIRVIGWDKDSLVVTGTLGRGAGKFFYFGGGGRGAKLGIDVPEQSQVDEKSDLEVRVPARAKLWIKAAGATIDVTDFHGGLDLYSVSGAIRIRGNPTQLYAESMDGVVEFSGATPFARVKTASGNITLAGSVDDATVSTVGGMVSATDLLYQRARLESVTGNIELAGAIQRGASVTTESHSGTITIAVPADVQAAFYVSNFQGSIKNGLTKAQPRLVRERGGYELAFGLGQGGADVNARNFKGDVVLKRRP